MNVITEEQVVAVESRLVNAIKESNVDALDELLHPNLLFMTPDGKTITKEMDLAAHREGNMSVFKVISVIENIQIVNDTAIVTVICQTEGIMMGNPISGKFRYIRFWKLVNNSLQVVAGSCSQI
jgi:hypothetical protein